MQKPFSFSGVHSSLRADTSSTPTHVHDRLDRFRNLKDGWLGPDGGKAPNHAGLDWLGDMIKWHYPKAAPAPRTYPTPDGGVSLEWAAGKLDIDVEVDLEKHTGWWYVFNNDTGTGEEDKVLDLNCKDGWRWIGDRLRDLMG